MATEKPRRLGRGLEALLTAQSQPAQPRDAAAEANELQYVAIKEVSSNPTQPRKEFHPGELTELAASLKESGLLQPITVRRSPTGRGYELIAGERRLRAATQLG